MEQKSTFSTRIGVIAATVGSAIGLGNIWRFPAEAQLNGGGAFLIIYIGCVFLLGIPVMLAEFSLGRAGGSDSVGNIRNLTPNSRWWVAGTIGLIASYLILSYYMVVAGWTVEYFADSLTGGLFDGYISGTDAENNRFFADRMDQYVTTALNPLIWTAVVILFNLAVLLLGVKKGIEKLSNWLMPLMFVLLIVFCAASFSLPGAMEGVKYFLYPDFSKIDIDVIINALGQAFFSLSLGMGILVTYSAYYPETVNLTRTATTVSLLDFMMAVLMGLIIFPAVTSFGIASDAGEVQGTTLVFITMPEIFAAMPAPRVWSALFFLLLAVAAITSTISLAEVSVAFVRDRFKVRRRTACFIVVLPLLATSSLCSLSLGAWPGLSLAGMPLFDFLDTFATNLLLPVSALLICLYVGWRLPRNFIIDQLSNFGTLPARMASVIAVIIKYIAPVLITLILVVKLINL